MNLLTSLENTKKKYYEMDNAIAARDKIIDDQREKIEEYREKYYDQLYENDGLKLDITDIRKEVNAALKDKLAVLEQLKDAKEDIKISDEVHSEKLAKFAQNLKHAEENLQSTEKKLAVAKNVVLNLREKLEERYIQIETMKHSSVTPTKFTIETQTSLKEELESVVNVDKFADEKKVWSLKFTELQSKINLQVENLKNSIKNLQQKRTSLRCKYGWKCSRKFCKYDHEYLYCYVANCVNTFKETRTFEHHAQDLHKDASNIQSTASDEVETEEEIEIGRTMSSTSSRTSSTTSSSSSPSTGPNISTSIENSFISDNYSEEESQTGGMS